LFGVRYNYCTGSAPLPDHTGEMNMNVKEYAEYIECKIFSKRDTVQEALDYAQMIANATENPAAVMTAVGVVLNTISHDLRQLDTEDITAL
jgi:hypothetical protein